MWFLAFFYVAITIAGLFPFRGIPVLNVALGFPLGAAVAYRAGSRVARDRARTVHNSLPVAPGTCADAPGYTILRDVLFWALATAGITMFVCWVELVGSLMAIKIFGRGTPISAWLPLLPSSILPNQFRAQLFAVIISPGLQILTTAFGGVLTLLLRQSRSSR